MDYTVETGGSTGAAAGRHTIEGGQSAADHTSSSRGPTRSTDSSSGAWLPMPNSGMLEMASTASSKSCSWGDTTTQLASMPSSYALQHASSGSEEETLGTVIEPQAGPVEPATQPVKTSLHESHLQPAVSSSIPTKVVSAPVPQQQTNCVLDAYAPRAEPSVGPRKASAATTSLVPQSSSTRRLDCSGGLPQIAVKPVSGTTGHSLARLTIRTPTSLAAQLARCTSNRERAQAYAKEVKSLRLGLPRRRDSGTSNTLLSHAPSVAGWSRGGSEYNTPTATTPHSSAFTTLDLSGGGGDGLATPARTPTSRSLLSSQDISLGPSAQPTITVSGRPVGADERLISALSQTLPFGGPPQGSPSFSLASLSQGVGSGPPIIASPPARSDSSSWPGLGPAVGVPAVTSTPQRLGDAGILSESGSDTCDARVQGQRMDSMGSPPPRQHLLLQAQLAIKDGTVKNLHAQLARAVTQLAHTQLDSLCHDELREAAEQLQVQLGEQEAQLGTQAERLQAQQEQLAITSEQLGAREKQIQVLQARLQQQAIQPSAARAAATAVTVVTDVAAGTVNKNGSGPVNRERVLRSQTSAPAAVDAAAKAYAALQGDHHCMRPMILYAAQAEPDLLYAAAAQAEVDIMDYSERYKHLEAELQAVSSEAASLRLQLAQAHTARAKQERESLAELQRVAALPEGMQHMPLEADDAMHGADAPPTPPQPAVAATSTHPVLLGGSHLEAPHNDPVGRGTAAEAVLDNRGELQVADGDQERLPAVAGVVQQLSGSVSHQAAQLASMTAALKAAQQEAARAVQMHAALLHEYTQLQTDAEVKVMETAQLKSQLAQLQQEHQKQQQHSLVACRMAAGAAAVARRQSAQLQAEQEQVAELHAVLHTQQCTAAVTVERLEGQLRTEQVRAAELQAGRLQVAGAAGGLHAQLDLVQQQLSGDHAYFSSDSKHQSRATTPRATTPRVTEQLDESAVGAFGGLHAQLDLVQQQAFVDQAFVAEQPQASDAAGGLLVQLGLVGQPPPRDKGQVEDVQPLLRAERDKAAQAIGSLQTELSHGRTEAAETIKRLRSELDLALRREALAQTTARKAHAMAEGASQDLATLSEQLQAVQQEAAAQLQAAKEEAAAQLQAAQQAASVQLQAAQQEAAQRLQAVQLEAAGQQETARSEAAELLAAAVQKLEAAPQPVEAMNEQLAVWRCDAAEQQSWESEQQNIVLDQAEAEQLFQVQQSTDERGAVAQLELVTVAAQMESGQLVVVEQDPLARSASGPAAPSEAPHGQLVPQVAAAPQSPELLLAQLAYTQRQLAAARRSSAASHDQLLKAAAVNDCMHASLSTVMPGHQVAWRMQHGSRRAADPSCASLTELMAIAACTTALAAPMPAAKQSCTAASVVDGTTGWCKAQAMEPSGSRASVASRPSNDPTQPHVLPTSCMLAVAIRLPVWTHQCHLVLRVELLLALGTFLTAWLCHWLPWLFTAQPPPLPPPQPPSRSASLQLDMQPPSRTSLQAEPRTLSALSIRRRPASTSNRTRRGAEPAGQCEGTAQPL